MSEPKWDLGWPTVDYRAVLRGAEVTVSFKPYIAYDLKKYLDEEYANRRTYSAEFIESTVVGDSPEATAFFQKYFVGAKDLIRASDGLPGPKENNKIMEWIAAKMPWYRPSFIKTCIGGFADEAYEKDEGEDFFSLDPVDKVRLKQYIYVPEMGDFATVVMTHVMKLTSAHHLLFQQATSKSKLHRKKGYFETPVNHDLIEQIYNQAIERIDNMALDGKDCLPENKDQWASLVPYWHKLAVVRDSFSEIEAKN